MRAIRREAIQQEQKRGRCRFPGCAGLAALAAVLLFSAAPATAQTLEKLTLESAVEMAMANHPGVEQLQAAVEKNQKLLSQAKAAWAPTLDYQFQILTYLDEASDAFITRFQDNGKFTNTLSAGYKVYDPSRKPALKARQSGVEASQLDLERFRRQLEYQVHMAFLQAWLAKEALSVELEARAYYGDLREDAKARFDEGLIPESDYLTFANAYDNARLQEVGLENDYRLAVLALESTIHREIGAGTDLVFSGSLDPQKEDDLKALEAKALSGRRDIQAAQARLKAAQEAVRIAKGSKRPTVSVGLNYQHSENAITDLDLHDDTTQAFAQVAWRLEDGNLRDNQIGELQAQEKEAQAQLDSLEWTARDDALESAYKINNAIDRLGILDGMIADAKKNLDILTLRYKEGLITVIKVTDAELSLHRAKLNRIRAQVDYGLARQGLRLATGDQ